MIKKTITLIVSLIIMLAFVGCSSKATLETDPELNLEYGNKMATMRLWDEAILKWENGTKLSPRDARFHNNLAVAFESRGNYEKALEHYKIALKLEPGNEIIKQNYDTFRANYEEKNLPDKPAEEEKMEEADE